MAGAFALALAAVSVAVCEAVRTPDFEVPEATDLVPAVFAPAVFVLAIFALALFVETTFVFDDFAVTDLAGAAGGLPEAAFALVETLALAEAGALLTGTAGDFFVPDFSVVLCVGAEPVEVVCPIPGEAQASAAAKIQTLRTRLPAP